MIGGMRIRSSDITNRSDYRERLREHHARVKATGRPLFVTEKGEPDVVVMSAKAYDDLAELADLRGILADIERSEADFAAGRTKDALVELRRIAERHGLDLNR